MSAPQTELAPPGGAVDATPALRLIGLRKLYGDVAAVDGVDVDVAPAEFFSLIGPSGCGKTTTLRMLAGLVDPSAGAIEIYGQDVTRIRPHKRPVNTVFQQYALFPHLSVFENVAFGLREHKVARREIEQRVREMLELVELSGRGAAKPSELSGGQQQRVALARALVLHPKVLLLDEPLGALDLKLRKALQLQLKEIQREVGITFVYVTHDQEEAFFMSDRVAIMRSGRIEQLGAPQHVYDRPETQFVADFVGESSHLGGVVTAVAGSDYEVDVEGVGSIRCRGVEGLGSGEKVVAIVRPETVRPDPPADGHASVDGRLLDVAYLGHHVSCVVEMAGGHRVGMSVAGAAMADSGLVAGGECRVGWPLAGMWLVPAE